MMAELKLLTDRGSFTREVTDFPEGVTDDGVLGYTIDTKKYVRTEKGRKFKSEEIGIWANGTDMTTKLQSRLNHSWIKVIELDADGGDIVIDGTLTIPTGKTLKINNGTRITGTGTLVNAKVEAGLYPIFAPTITLTNCDPLIGFFPPEWFGAVGNGTNDDTASMQACCNAAIRNTGGVVKLMPNKNYKITSVTLPSFKEGHISQFTLDGGNAKITVDGANTGFIKNVTAQGGTTGADVEVNSRILFHNIRFVGSAVAGNKGVRVAPTYGTMFTMCSFLNFDIAAELRFCLNSIFINCFFQNSISYDVILADGDWAGATGNNSQSNQTKMINCRHFCRSGQLAAVQILDTSGIVLDDCIYEGANPVRNIEFISTGSTTVQHFNIIRPHVENAPTSESIYLNTSALVLVEQYWSQLAHTAIRCVGTATPKVILRDTKYLQNDNVKFAFANNGTAIGIGVFQIDNIDYSLIGDATTFWTRKCIVDTDHSLPFYKYFSTNANQFSTAQIFETLTTKSLSVSGGNSVFNNTAYHKSLTYLEDDIFITSGKLLKFGNTAGANAQALYGSSTYMTWVVGSRNSMRMHNDGRLNLGWAGTSAAVDVDMSGARDPLLPPKLAADPGTPVEAMFYHNTVSKKLKHHNGTAWKELGDADTNTAQTLTNKTLGTGTKVNLGTVSAGDIYYGAADGTLTRLPKGTDGTVLKIVAGVPAWADDAVGGLGEPTIRSTAAATDNFLITDDTLLVDTTAGNVAITIDNLTSKRVRYIKKISTDANTVTITPALGTIDGAANHVLDAANEVLAFQRFESNYYTLNK